ncbi:hypothetical protein OF83DRAFT_1070922, partial [Amylostereum chailletii]
EPPASEPASKALGRGIHFIQEGSSIMVGYLDSKEITAWNIDTRGRSWTQILRKRIGSTAWSPETHQLLVWNLEDGIDVYQLKDEGQLKPIRCLKMNLQYYFPKLVDFAQQGRLAVSGTDRGEVFIWDIETGTLKQTLIHGPGESIPSPFIA